MALSRNHWRPFAAGRDEPIRRQHLQHVAPARSLAARRQAPGPEAVELQLAPQDAGEPARAPLARPAKPHLRQTQADHVAVFDERAVILGEQGERPRPTGVLVKHFDRLAPRLGLGGVDLAEVEDVTLNHPPAGEALALDDAPVEIRLPVLPQEHRSKEFDTSRGSCESSRLLVGLHYEYFRRTFKTLRQLHQVLSSPR